MPLKILFIKLTSLGDLIHALPALSDLYAAHPNAKVDWAIDENFQEIATWHPAIDKIFTANHRKWRSEITQKDTYTSAYKFIKSIRGKKYDCVIDGQGNFKSAIISRCSKGMRIGYDRHSAREPIAFLGYDHHCSISLNLHAISRLRILFSQALAYPLPQTPPNFGIDRDKLIPPPCELPSEFIVFIHNASWKTKVWPEAHWAELIKKVIPTGLAIVLPWGNEEEKKRAERLSTISDQVIVLPKVKLSEIAYVLSRAKVVVGVDTGLIHVAAALNVPSICLFGPTDARLVGALGDNHLHIESTLPCARCDLKKCKFAKQGGLQPPCLAGLSPNQVFSKLEQLLGGYCCNSH